MLLHYLGRLTHSLGDNSSAQVYLEESLAIAREGEDRIRIVMLLETFVGFAADTGKSEWAAVLCGAAEALREEIGAPLPPGEREGYDPAVAKVHGALGEEAFTTAWAIGRAMTLEQAMDYATQKLGT